MDEFVKVFAVGNHQMLFYTGKDKFDSPCLHCMTRINGIDVEFTSSYADSDEGYEKRDKALNEVVTQEFAEHTFQGMLDLVGESVSVPTKTNEPNER